VLKDPNNINDQIQCTITDMTTQYRITIMNFGDYQGDGFIVIELLMKNPITPRWTAEWKCFTFADIIDDGVGNWLAMDYNWAAYGRTWVGKNVPFPN
jgi:hypothetical protein